MPATMDPTALDDALSTIAQCVAASLVQGAEGVSITEVVNRAFRAYFERGS
jgi:hypothetical protein